MGLELVLDAEITSPDPIRLAGSSPSCSLSTITRFTALWAIDSKWVIANVVNIAMCYLSWFVRRRQIEQYLYRLHAILTVPNTRLPNAKSTPDLAATVTKHAFHALAGRPDIACSN